MLLMFHVCVCLQAATRSPQCSVTRRLLCCVSAVPQSSASLQEEKLALQKVPSLHKYTWNSHRLTVKVEYCCIHSVWCLGSFSAPLTCLPLCCPFIAFVMNRVSTQAYSDSCGCLQKFIFIDLFLHVQLQGQCKVEQVQQETTSLWLSCRLY